MKTCSRCGETKNESEFHRKAKRCKPCACAVAREWKIENPERAAANAHLAYQNDKQVYKDRARKWTAEHRERRLEISRASDEKHREARRKKGVEYNRRQRIENREHTLTMGRYHANIRRSRLRGVQTLVTPNEVVEIFARAKGRCVYCNSVAKLTLDHFFPISQGGDNVLENLVPCCKSCNSRKGTSTGEDWLYDNHGVDGLARAIIFLEHGIAITEVE